MIKTWQECGEIHEHLMGPLGLPAKLSLMQREIDQLREALAKQEQSVSVSAEHVGEPLCTAAMFDDAFLAKSGLDPKTPLYTTPYVPTGRQPAQKPWVGLTDEEMHEIIEKYMTALGLGEMFIDEVEAKLKEKNT